MPRPKRNYTNVKQEHTIQKDDSMCSTIMDMNSKIMDNNHLKLVMWRAEVKDRMKDAYIKLNDMQKEKLAMFELEFKNSLMSIPKNVLNTVVDIDSEKFRAAFLGVKLEYDDLEQTLSPSPVVPTTIRRRSRSASTIKVTHASGQKTHRLRSTSVDIYKTPKGKVRLSSIMSHKKYTVMKPKKSEDSGVHVKRVMKPNEEAISTCGSPLYVGSCSLGAPHVNIPLPGGVILNIEPKKPKGPLEVPGLDAKTRDQIKMLCEQLKTILD